MKKQIRSFVSFSRTEKKGIAALCGIIVLLIVIRFSMHLWVHPAEDVAQEQKLRQAWEEFQSIAVTDSMPAESMHLPGKQALPDSVDINTADSQTLILFKGIGPATAHKILMRRQKNGPFTDISQVWETGSFSAEEITVLKAHLKVPANSNGGK